MGKPLLLMRKMGLRGPFMANHAGVPGLSKAMGAFQSGAVTGPPVFDGIIANMTVEVGRPMEVYNAYEHFQTGGRVTEYELIGAPAWMGIHSVSGRITGTPDVEDTTLGVIVRGTNPEGSADSNPFNVDSVISAPVFDGSIPDMEQVVGTPIEPYDASAHFQTAGVPDTYALEGAPLW